MARRNLILFDDQAWAGLLPLTWLRPVADLRIGILKISERWERLLTGQASTVTQDYLAEEFALAIANDNYFLNASALPTPQLVRAILELSQGEALTLGDELLAARLDGKAVRRLSEADESGTEDIAAYAYEGGDVTLLRRPYDLFAHNGEAIRRDFDSLTHGRHSEALPEHAVHFGGGQVFVEPGAHVEPCYLDTADGPIYLGRGARVLAGAMLKGPLALCEEAVVKMGAKVYGGTTLGPNCKVGGEVQNVVFQAYSNKGHDGYLGNAVVGQWCNIGADTNASNLKNNYAEVRVWDYEAERFAPSGRQFVGLIMGDHAKCGINTMFNTGTVVGTAANVYGAGFPRAFVPDFAWGGAGKFVTHRLGKVVETANRMMSRRGHSLSEHQRGALEQAFAMTAPHRRWEAATSAEAEA